MASHRRPFLAASSLSDDGEHDGPQHSRGAHASPRRGLLRPRWIMLATGLVLVATGAGTWALARGGSGAPPAPASVPASVPASARPMTSALMQALGQANELGPAKGELPPASCRPRTTALVTCLRPAPAISWATFQTFPSLTALYRAYLARARSATHGTFRQNTGDCGLAAPGTGGDEVAWNHQFRHPRTYTVAQMTTGTVTDTQAVGRVFCITMNGDQEEMVWTQDDGRLLGALAGTDHEAVWYWWLAVHHNIVLGGPAMPMPGMTAG